VFFKRRLRTSTPFSAIIALNPINTGNPVDTAALITMLAFSISRIISAMIRSTPALASTSASSW
jgi:hypothetical protein